MSPGLAASLRLLAWRLRRTNEITLNDLLFELGAVATGAAFIAAAMVVVWLLGRRYQRKQRLTVERWCSGRSVMTDQEFLAACGVTADPLQMRVAIVTRNMIAEYTGVPAATIRPDDGAADFGHLLDSMDWLEVWFRIEKESDVRIGRFDRAMLVARDNRLRIKDYIKAVSSAPEKGRPQPPSSPSTGSGG
jgi:acyl carrier protein